MKTLLFDLDETLIHCNELLLFNYIIKQYNFLIRAS